MNCCSSVKTRLAIALIAALSAATLDNPVVAQERRPPPVATPFAQPDFHFSDPARDTRYWQLYADMDRTLAAFREARFAAMRAVAVPGPRPGSPEWFAARAQVEHAIRMRRPARDALEALITFLRRERPRLTAEEAEAAYDIIRVNEMMLVATSDALVDLLGMLAGLRMDRWPP
jgi:hypothetical protein